MEGIYFLFSHSAFRKLTAIALAAITLTGCASKAVKMEKRQGYYASHAFQAKGQDERVRFVVLHYTALDDSRSLNTLVNDQVSAHYLILQQPESKNRQPVVLQLVDENKRAWHAGVSSWNGRSNLNDSSIGIEIVNQGYTDDAEGNRSWYPYNETQIAAVMALVKDISHRYQITPDNVLGHSDIAPLRKQDPGRLFPWKRLAAAGIGAWPEQAAVTRFLAGRLLNAPADVKNIQALLQRYGYDIPQTGVLDEQTKTTLTAFQMHFRPRDISGNADAETEAIASALVEQYRETGKIF